MSDYVGLMTDSDDGTTCFVMQEEYPTREDFAMLLEHEGILEYEGLTLEETDEEGIWKLDDEAIEEFHGYWCTDEECELIDPGEFDQHFHDAGIEGISTWKGWRFG